MSVINTNTKALAAQASLSNVNNKLAVSMERLSTGLRINSAKDDAAGLAIANRMTSDIRGFAVAIRNANDGLSMAQTAEGAIGQVSDMLQRMRELAVQASNGSMNADNRQASQLEISQLKAQIDDVAKQTNFNGIKLLDGSAGKIDLQTGVRAGELMTMSIDSVSTKDIGLGARASLTSTAFSGTVAELTGNVVTKDATQAAGDLILNGVTIRASSANDDLLSYDAKEASAIAKVAAINASSAQTGIVATVGNTTVGGSVMSTGLASKTGSLSINGVRTADFSTAGDAGANRAVTVAAINAISAQTGVRAIDSGDLKKGVVLVADDARNITVAINADDASGTAYAAALTTGSTGIGAAKVYTGTYQLSSTTGGGISVGVSSNGNLRTTGLTAGSYTANVSAMATVDRAVTAVAGDIKQLNAGDLRINGTAIVASSTADDTASDTTAASSTKAASAIAIAAAINKASAQTGVTAKAAPNEIVGTSFTAGTYNGEEMHVNGTVIDLSSLDTLGHTATRADVADLINQYTGQTGVTASDNGRGLTLVAADGRNVSLGTTLHAADLGVDSGAIKETAAAGATDTAKTTYARVVLQSDKSFTLEGGSDGNANFELLGFKTGTYGGVDNGVKVAQIDISTQAGAQVALTALDSALKSVSLNQAKLGAFQNRLDAVVANLTEVNQNMSASRSRIQDTDYATETTNLAKSQIIQQAATAMLAQANQSSQSVLSLLK
jgi:flagellin